ncbi:hypothetical protein CIPAW_10G005200 [Carya illinoinensis]|uniref:Uncharacterized protein n=1 Tax=Carya illinoinensis TaxID=32201 RepID=A0A8T1P8C4_CARIL|nr:hypothetical protein CIPAW_10G005200 [Carya illinoinensis]
MKFKPLQHAYAIPRFHSTLQPLPGGFHRYEYNKQLPICMSHSQIRCVTHHLKRKPQVQAVPCKLHGSTSLIAKNFRGKRKCRPGISHKVDILRLLKIPRPSAPFST